MPISKGILSIKFLEGMKVRLQTQADGTKKLVDLNGTNLTSLERLMNQIGVKNIYNPFGNSPEELDAREIKTEAYFNTDTPNQNLFYKLEVDENTDIWSLVHEMKKLPFLETSFPSILPTAPSNELANPNDPILKAYNSLTIPYQTSNVTDELTKTGDIPTGKKGAWSYLKSLSTDIEGGTLSTDNKNISHVTHS